jgi:hypothetical protein
VLVDGVAFCRRLARFPNLFLLYGPVSAVRNPCVSSLITDLAIKPLADKNKLKPALREHLIASIKKELSRRALAAERKHLVYYANQGPFGFTLSLSTQLPFRRLLALARFRLGPS